MNKNKAKLKFGPNTFEVLENGDYVECAVSGKNIPLKDLEYWNVELQEAYFSSSHLKRRHSILSGPVRLKMSTTPCLRR